MFGGGAHRGNAYAGVVRALEVLQECKGGAAATKEEDEEEEEEGGPAAPRRLLSFRGAGGSSVGALVAAGLVAGLTAEGLRDYLLRTDTSDLGRFLGDPTTAFATACAIGGTVPHTVLSDAVEGLIRAGGVYAPGITLGELAAAGAPALRVTATAFVCRRRCRPSSSAVAATGSVVSCELMVLDAATAPDMRVADAVAASMAIPGVVAPVPLPLNSSPSAAAPTTLTLLLDGGMLDNVPGWLFPADATAVFYLCDEEETTEGGGAAAASKEEGAGAVPPPFPPSSSSSSTGKTDEETPLLLPPSFSIATCARSYLDALDQRGREDTYSSSSPSGGALFVPVRVPRLSVAELLDAPASLRAKLVERGSASMVEYMMRGECALAAAELAARFATVLFIGMAIAWAVLQRRRQREQREQRSPLPQRQYQGGASDVPAAAAAASSAKEGVLCVGGGNVGGDGLVCADEVEAAAPERVDPVADDPQ